MRKRFHYSYDKQRGFYVDLPHYQEVPNTVEPIIKNIIHSAGVCAGIDGRDALKHRPSVLIDLPDDVELDNKGQIDARKLRNRYPSHCHHGDAGFTPPKIIGDR